LIAQRGQQFAEIATVPAGPLLGLDPEQQRHSALVPLSPGAALAFYTDGLVERRKRADQHTDPDVERFELVRRAFVAADNAETACSRIIAGGLGDDSVEDDVALFVVRRPA
jgi:sigma-B regulation protein RsbU (phosphoserine phosphatase)